MSALTTLCQTMPYEKISVGDIAKEAGIARQTFYAYAPSKDELLLSIIDDVFEEFFEKVSPVIINMDEIYRISLELFQTWNNNAEKLDLVLSVNLDHLVLQRIRRYITRLSGNALRENNIAYPEGYIMEYLIEYVTGSSFQVLRTWMAKGRKETPQQMAEFHRMVLHGSIVSMFNTFGINQ